MGKITVKHYLNKQLKPEKDGEELYYPLYVSITVKSKNIKRRSHLMHDITESNLHDNLFDFPETKNQLNYEVNLLTRIVKLYINDIEKKTVNKHLIYFRPSKGYNSKDDFINLLNAYIDFYSDSIFLAISAYCTNEIENEVYNKLTNVFNLSDQNEAREMFKYESHDLLSQEAEFIYNNLSSQSIELLVLRERLRSFLAPYFIKTGYDIPLIDWIEKVIQSDLRIFLSTYKRKPEYYVLKGFVIDSNLINKYIKVIDGVIYSPNYINIAQSARGINI